MKTLKSSQIPPIFLTLCLLLPLLLSTGCSKKSQTSAPAVNAICIASDCDSNLVQRVASFARNELDSKISITSLTSRDISSYNRNPNKMVKSLSGKYTFTVMLLDNPKKLPDSDQVNNLAILSINMLKPSTNAVEALGRRIEKETMCQIGRMIGMEPCPIIFCAMFQAQDDADLDTKGRNFCPPCGAKAGELLKAKGLLNPEPIEK